MSHRHSERVITEASYQLIGVCLSPHLFRVAGATTAALYSHDPHEFPLFDLVPSMRLRSA
jgi:hypothetical protein